MKSIVLVLFFVIGALAQDSYDSTGVRVALKIYDDCSKADGFAPCLKKKAITFLDRLGRMEKFSVAEGVVVTKAADAPQDGPVVTEDALEKTLPRAVDAKDEALTDMLLEKVTTFIGSRSVEVSLPKISGRELAEDFGIEEGRKKSGGGGGGGKGGMKGMMGGMMMGIAAKMAALIPIAIAGLFLLAGKALITAKIALLLSGIIAIKKLLGSKQGGGGGGHGGGGWQSSGGHGSSGGWQSSGSGGWDKRSMDEAQNLAYSAYAPQ